MLKFAKMFPRTRFKNVQKCVEIWQNELKTNKLKFAKIFFMTIFKNGNVFKFAETFFITMFKNVLKFAKMH